MMRNFANTELTALVGSEPAYQAPAGKQEIPPHVAKFVDRLFVRLKAVFPAWQAAFDGEEGYQEAKRLWLEALVNNGITTAAQFKRGIAQAERESTPFFPSVGQFIVWCKAENYAELGLPDEAELKHRLNKFRAFGGFYNIENFEFASTAEYWLITKIANDAQQKAYTEMQEDKAIKKALEEMANRLKSGVKLPEPVRTIAKETTFNPHNPQAVKRFFNRPELQF